MLKPRQGMVWHGVPRHTSSSGLRARFTCCNESQTNKQSKTNKRIFSLKLKLISNCARRKQPTESNERQTAHKPGKFGKETKNGKSYARLVTFRLGETKAPHSATASTAEPAPGTHKATMQLNHKSSEFMVNAKLG